MIWEYPKKKEPKFIGKVFFIIDAIRYLYFFKNCMDVLLSIKQIKSVKNISLVIFFADISNNIRCGVFVVTTVYMLKHSIVNFSCMSNSLSKDF